MAIEMSQEEVNYWNSLDTPILSHTKSCLCAECKVLRVKKKYKIREKTATEEAQARRRLFEQLESLGVTINPAVMKEGVDKPKNESEIDFLDDEKMSSVDNHLIIEEENRRKIEAQLKFLGL